LSSILKVGGGVCWLCRTRKCHKGGIGGNDGIVGAEGFAKGEGPSVSQHRSDYLALVK
jgi:hypothetical protein